MTRVLHRLSMLAAALSLMFAAAPAAAQPDPGASETVAFVGVNVVPMDHEGVLENHTVLVRGDRIVSVEPADTARIPQDAVRIEGAGLWLSPGLAEMHGHVPGPNDPSYAEDVLFLYAANGVTTVRNMAGHPSHLALRDRVMAGELTGPVLHAASPWLSGENAGTPDAARQAVRDHQAAGFDLIKMGGIPRDAYIAMAETAHEIGMPFAGHVPFEVGLTGALEARQTSIDHYDRYVEFLAPDGTGNPGFFGSAWIDQVDESRIPDAVARTVAAGTWNVPTLSLVEHLASDESAESMIAWPEMRYMPRSVLDGWVNAKREFQARADFQPEAAAAMVDLRRRLTLALHEAGAPIALGSDAPQFFNVPGFSIHHEMRMMAAAGLSPYEVLVTGTRNAALYFGEPEEFGVIAPGRRADLILTRANPLDDLENLRDPAGVMLRGRWLSEDDIRAGLDAIADRRSQ